MTTQAPTAPATLNAYEAKQVERIAEWKGEHPDPFSELFKRVTQPGMKLIERLIPDRLAVVAINQTYELSAVSAGQRDIMVKAKVEHLQDLLHRSLEECDQLALGVGRTSRAIALVEGAVTGAGGIITTALDVPLLFALALRTIMRVGHCYGFRLDHQRDRRLVLGILLLGTSSSLERKQNTLCRLREIEEWLLEETQEELIGEEAVAFLFQLEIFEEVPGIDIVSGGLLNLAFMYKVEQAARFVFQERWLRENGKVTHIEPAKPVHRIAHHGGSWRGLAMRSVYASAYGASFAVALPAYTVASMLGSSNNAVTRGIRDGARAASARVDRLMNAAEPAVSTREAMPALAPA